MEKKKKPLVKSKTGWESIKEELGKCLGEARLSLKITQSELSARSGVSLRTISLIESKLIKHKPREITIARLAIATEKDPNKWLSLVFAKTLPPEEITRLRKNSKARVNFEDLKAPEEIKEEVKKEIRQEFKPPEEIKSEIRGEMSEKYEPSDKIKGELREYVDKKFSDLERKVRDLEVIVEHLSNWMKELLLSRQPLSKESGR